MDEVLTIRMHTKVTKGGRNLSFAALVAVGNGNGRVGLGYGKAPGVPMAIEKANKQARENMIEVPLIGDTVCHQHTGRHKSSEVLIKPAAPGTGVKAGATVRDIMQVLGVHNVLTKSLGRNNPLNLAQATMNALTEMRSVDEIEELRGVPVFLKHPQIDALKEETGEAEGTEEADEAEEEADEAQAETGASTEESEEAEATEQTPGGADAGESEEAAASAASEEPEQEAADDEAGDEEDAEEQ